MEQAYTSGLPEQQLQQLQQTAASASKRAPPPTRALPLSPFQNSEDHQSLYGDSINLPATEFARLSLDGPQCGQASFDMSATHSAYPQPASQNPSQHQQAAANPSMGNAELDEGFDNTGFDNAGYSQYQSSNQYLPPASASNGTFFDKRTSNIGSNVSSSSRSDISEFKVNQNHQYMYSGTSRNSINSNVEEELHGSSGRSSSSNNGLQQPGVAAGVSLHQFSSQPRLDSDGNADFAPRPRPRPGRTSLAPTPARSISGSNGAEPNPFLTYSRHSIYSNSHASLSRGSIYGLGTPPVNKRMSHTLVNGSSALDMYREAAKKTQDERIQLEYAKFLLQSIENLEDPTVREDFNVTYSVYLPGSDPLAAALSGGANSSSASLPLGQQATEVDPENREKLVAEAVYWVKLLQRKGNTEASYIAGTWFESGKYGIELDKSKALQLFTYAAKNHHASAAYKVAVHQEERKQYARAFSYFQMAAALGDVSANYRMANVFLDGTLGKKMNVKQALIYLRRAAELANDECPYGALLLGRMYLGEYPNPAVYDVVFVDSEEAQKLLDKAARLGSADAQYLLGRLFEFGECKFPVDPYTSIHYYQLAAEQDSAEAQMALSGWYLSGAEGIINPDDQLTFDWGHRAAQQGLPRAEFAMGYYYEMGIGCEKNINRAIEWYERAASHGSSEAQERLNQRVVGTTSESAAALRRRVTQKREKASGRGKKSVSRKGKDSKDSNGCIVM